MIILKNLERAPRVYEIPVAHAPGQQQKVGAADRDAQGNVTLQVQQRTFPSSVTLMARGTEGDTSEPLPDSVEKAPAIAEAKRARKLEVVKLPDVSAPAVENVDAPDTEGA